MTTKHGAVVCIVLGMLLAAAPLAAHHSFAGEFDATKPVKLTGNLVKWEMINPHSWFHIDVKGPEGQLVRWMIEGGSPNQLIRLGVTKNTLPVGVDLVIEGYLARDGSNKAVGRNFILADGRRLFLGGSAPESGNDSGPVVK
ncbi:MAG: hypothetical protein A3I61_14920 [Acidobacteria bacterium RIFCSPLOWO2_02_FULL_68_18]|nr:MAG: hypothetical protein A3I61_14920 [Acidobacteria bacterium RIFCSPLOWO2_02_FULL_68_18]OFW50375.1 MAG: hypothetical protein A3G77_07905 [Acidobacteria bacterium RIFCSPLOWO2_12_FULL_68_19]